LGANRSAEFCASALPAAAIRKRENSILWEGPRVFGNKTGEENGEQTCRGEGKENIFHISDINFG
jgi:hypothetical protein